MSPRRGPSSSRKTLIDILCSRYGQYDRQNLYARILHGDVRVEGHTERDSKRVLRPDCRIDVIGLDQQESKYVSRGGDKLAPVLNQAEQLGFCFRSQVMLDAGASTGGFTDCLLQAGAAVVHAVDVGYNQLDFRLRRDDRVRVRERCNILSLDPGELEPAPIYAVADLSFRSMQGAAAHILSLLQRPEQAEAGGTMKSGNANPCPGKPENTYRPLLLALIKPQFELAYSPVDSSQFNGIIDSPDTAQAVMDDTSARLMADGLVILGRWKAGIPGSAGNQEYFWLLGRSADSV